MGALRGKSDRLYLAHFEFCKRVQLQACSGVWTAARPKFSPLAQAWTEADMAAGALHSVVGAAPDGDSYGEHPALIRWPFYTQSSARSARALTDIVTDAASGLRGEQMKKLAGLGGQGATNAQEGGGCQGAAPSVEVAAEEEGGGAVRTEDKVGS